jgi:hypothetical protein
MYPEMTIQEIEAAYPDEWVLLSEPKVDDSGQMQRGALVFHSPDRDLLHRRMAELRLPDSGVLYTGDPTSGIPLLL